MQTPFHAAHYFPEHTLHICTRVESSAMMTNQNSLSSSFMAEVKFCTFFSSVADRKQKDLYWGETVFNSIYKSIFFFQPSFSTHKGCYIWLLLIHIHQAFSPWAVRHTAGQDLKLTLCVRQGFGISDKGLFYLHISSPGLT